MPEYIIHNAKAIVESIHKLHSHCPAIDTERRETGPRMPGEFDPNLYMTALSHLRLQTGYVLDFTYIAFGSGGRPAVYARRVDDLQIADANSVITYSEQHPLSEFLLVDDSPESWFDLTAFLVLAGQFYLYWHALYNDIRFVTSPDELARILGSLEDLQTSKKDEAMKFDPRVLVSMEESHVAVTYCAFSSWHGFLQLRTTYQRHPPHRILKGEQVAEIPYDCGIRF